MMQATRYDVILQQPFYYIRSIDLVVLVMDNIRIVCGKTIVWKWDGYMYNIQRTYHCDAFMYLYLCFVSLNVCIVRYIYAQYRIKCDVCRSCVFEFRTHFALNFDSWGLQFIGWNFSFLNSK